MLLSIITRRHTTTKTTPTLLQKLTATTNPTINSPSFLGQISYLSSSSSSSPNATTHSPPHPSESFLSGSNSIYADEMYRLWRQDPNKVHSSWSIYFSNLEKGLPPGQAFSLPPTLDGGNLIMPSVVPATTTTTTKHQQLAKPTQTDLGFVASDDAANIVSLVRGYQARGHLKAKLDPLGLTLPPPDDVLDLTPQAFGFSEADLDREFNIPDVPGVDGILGNALGPRATLRKLLEALRTTYCGTVGVEYMHIGSREKANFIRSRVERDFSDDVLKKNATWGRFLSVKEKSSVLSRLHFAEMFEQFLASRWNTAKRFGMEGVESSIPGLKSYIDRSSELGATHFVIGMPHRGRLNVLANVMRKPLETIYSEFHGTHVDAEKHFEELEQGYQYTGDVKYHMGTTYKRTYEDGRTVSLSLLANPSHLECVNPVVHGKTRAKQFYEGDTTGAKTASIIMHGDAAFAGQGVVYESMQLAKLRYYSTGGTLHVVVNNQIGFTTDPQDARSTPYASDLGKAFGCPIFHVNADDPDSVAYIFKLAAEWRQRYLSDVIVDVIGYRRWGHNEMDEARFTQPTMYEVIRKHPTVLQLHSKRVVDEGTFTPAQVEAARKDASDTLERAYENAKNLKPGEMKEDWLDSKWRGFKSPKQLARIKNTGVAMDVLKEIGEACFSSEKLPNGFSPHPKVQQLLKERLHSVRSGQGIDWGAAEHLAYGSLVLEGNHVRLSGQDVQRGTFSHRHAMLHDMKTNNEFCPLNNIRPLGKGPGNQAEFHACNSCLSEFAVSGFELGFSLENPNALIMWEAQFGDFANGAQVIMDQFISSGETKWLRQSGIVWLLPHGYDGQGPEHSSCRLERFLQLSDEPRDTVPKMSRDERMQIQQCNIQIVNCTTPAQIFHVLRRQVHREFRKPLVVATPKYLLRLRECVSPLEDFGPDSKFKRAIFETDERVNSTDDKKIRKLIFVVGKLYYHLAKRREELKAFDCAIVRIEQVCPFPFDKVAQAVQQYPNAQMIYAQEEPMNMGSWFYADDRIFTACRVLLGEGRRCEYVGRKSFASPAIGYGRVHEFEQNEILKRVFE
jgi:2-oxoglutarate dehydrogenase E1 component